MLYVLVAVAIVWGLTTLYLAYRFREVRKFLAGAFFVSWGIQLYLYFAKVSVPLLGTNIVFTPEISAVRSIPHFIFFVLCLYFGYFSKPKGTLSSAGATSADPEPRPAGSRSVRQFSVPLLLAHLLLTVNLSSDLDVPGHSALEVRARLVTAPTARPAKRLLHEVLSAGLGSSLVQGTGTRT